MFQPSSTFETKPGCADLQRYIADHLVGDRDLAARRITGLGQHVRILAMRFRSR